jgi:adenosylcobinamide-GDP ribazoletransferase
MFGLNIFRGFVTAIRTLTILPVPGREAGKPADSLYYFPLVGGIIGGIVLLVVMVVAGPLGWLGGSAVAGVFVLVWLTRALHLDGLSDTVDACLASPDRERRLAIMKDPHIGAFGTAAIVLALLCKVIAFERLCATEHSIWIILPVILSRTVMVLVIVCLPYARTEGGKACEFFSGSGPAHFIVAGALALILCLPLAGMAGLLAAGLAFALGLVAVWWMKVKFGGATGDLLGFTGETIECILYFLLAMASVFI